MNIAYNNSITVDEVNAIRKSNGWRQTNPEQLSCSLNGSTMIVAAYDNDNAIGMSRLIWDGGSTAYIPVVLVIPDYHKQEIEAQLIKLILNFLRTKLKPGFGIQVDIKVWNNQESYYENLGFQKSTPQRRGVPMHICLTNQIELTDSLFKQCDFSEK